MLLVSIENMQYAVTIDVLHTVCLFCRLGKKDVKSFENKHMRSLVFISGPFSWVVVCFGCPQVFSAFGTVQKIAIFEKNAGFQALVQYPGTLVYTGIIALRLWVANLAI